MTFDVRVLEGGLTGGDGPAAVFIDIIGMPLTPLSFAGVARRTARRAAWYGAAAAPYHRPPWGITPIHRHTTRRHITAPTDVVLRPGDGRVPVGACEWICHAYPSLFDSDRLGAGRLRATTGTEPQCFPQGN